MTTTSQSITLQNLVAKMELTTLQVWNEKEHENNLRKFFMKILFKSENAIAVGNDPLCRKFQSQASFSSMIHVPPLRAFWALSLEFVSG
jgi:hypothetical protein